MVRVDLDTDRGRRSRFGSSGRSTLGLGHIDILVDDFVVGLVDHITLLVMLLVLVRLGQHAGGQQGSKSDVGTHIAKDCG